MRDFIIEFIEKNNHMIASDIGRNNLIEQASRNVINFLHVFVCLLGLFDMLMYDLNFKRSNNDLQNITKKTEDISSRSPLKTGWELLVGGQFLLP